MTTVAVCERFLPGPDDHDYAVELAAQILRQPDVWAIVLILADELELHGEVGESIVAFLPIPFEVWSPSLLMRDAVPLVVRPSVDEERSKRGEPGL